MFGQLDYTLVEFRLDEEMGCNEKINSSSNDYEKDLTPKPKR